jgi:hypothetical protein
MNRPLTKEELETAQVCGALELFARHLTTCERCTGSFPDLTPDSAPAEFCDEGIFLWNVSEEGADLNMDNPNCNPEVRG